LPAFRCSFSSLSPASSSRRSSSPMGRLHSV
jgi:hypothetical protein